MISDNQFGCSYPNCKESPGVFSRLLCWMLPHIKEQVGNEISELTGLGSHMISSHKSLYSATGLLVLKRQCHYFMSVVSI